MYIGTYDEYLKCFKIITVEEMEAVHKEMLSEIGNDEDALELYEDFVQAATRYADFRANWCLMSVSEKMERDSSRTSAHDVIISRINAIGRYLKMNKKSVVWRDKFGYTEDDPRYRKAIGDFACYVVFINSINAR